VQQHIGTANFTPDEVLTTPQRWQPEGTQQNMMLNILQSMGTPEAAMPPPQAPPVTQPSPVLDAAVRKLHQKALDSRTESQEPEIQSLKRLGSQADLSSEDESSPAKNASKKQKSSET
jgi:hypothetical protein